MIHSLRASTLIKALNVERAARTFSSSTAVLKKRLKANASFEDAFASDEDDLFSSPLKRASESPSIPRASKVAVPGGQRSRAPAELFEEQFTYVSARIGQRPALIHPQVRKNALRRLLHHSQEAAHLERLAELLVAWRNGGRSVDHETTLEFIDRCVKWNPKLLVEVFSNRQRYGLDIPDLHEARRILRRIVFTPGNDTLQLAVAFAALYPSYGLPSATSDLTSCVLLAQACCRSSLSEPETKAALSSLMPSLMKALASGTSSSGPKTTDDLKNLGKGNDAGSVASKRESGFTQTDAVEWKWVNAGVQDMLSSLKKHWPEKADKYTRPLSAFLDSRLSLSS